VCQYNVPFKHAYFTVMQFLEQKVTDQSHKAALCRSKNVPLNFRMKECTNCNKKLSCRKETVRLLRGSVLAKYNWKTIFCRHYRSIFKDFNHCHVCTVNACFLQSSEDSSLQPQFLLTILLCLRSVTRHSYLLTYLL